MATHAGNKATAMATDAGDKAEQVGDSKALEVLARVGLVAYGVVHFLIGWLALQIAWGLSGRESADTSGAMKTLWGAGSRACAVPEVGPGVLSSGDRRLGMIPACRCGYCI